MGLANFKLNFSLRNDISEWASSRLNYYFPFKTQYAISKGPTSKSSREKVSHYPYIELNNPCHKAWIIIDVDCIEMTKRLININSYEDTGIPVPNLVLRNPNSERSQLIYAIDPVAVHGNARWKPQELYKLVKSSLNHLIEGADHNFHSRISQNPLCTQWDLYEYHECQYSLTELLEEIPQDAIDKAIPGIYSKTTEPELNMLDNGFRNVGVFNYLRFFAYKRIDTALETLSFEEWSQLLLRRAKELNEQYCLKKLPDAEVTTLSNSVANGTWNKGYGQKRPGLMGLPKEMPIEEKQVLGARYAASIRKKTTLDRIKEALQSIVTRDSKITKAEIAKQSGVSSRTIYRRWEEVSALLNAIISNKKEEQLYALKSMTNSAPQVSSLDLSKLFSFSLSFHSPFLCTESYSNIHILKQGLNDPVLLRAIDSFLVDVQSSLCFPWMPSSSKYSSFLGL